jgi:AraC-like DNA-binding protein
MNYREVGPPEHLRSIVKLGWTLSIPDDAPGWIDHIATPDGCMELIRRLSGRSHWHGDQPNVFVAGAITKPATLRLGAGSCFVALRIWPWAWPLISGRSPGELTDRWAPLVEAPQDFHMPDTVEAAFAVMSAFRPDETMRAIAAALPSSRTPVELAAAAGLSPRALQRWFEANVGQPPRTYLRMVRFGDAFAGLPAANSGLADHAMGHGFADQAHMSREFKSLAGAPPRRAKERGRGPFIGPEIDRN